MIVDLDISKLKVLFIGAGEITARKLTNLCNVPNELRIVSESFSASAESSILTLVSTSDMRHNSIDELREFFRDRAALKFEAHAQRSIFILERCKIGELGDGEVLKSDLIFCCTNDKLINHDIATFALKHGKIVNNVSEMASSNMRNVATKRYRHFSLAVSSKVPVPALSKWICEMAGSKLLPELDEFVRVCSKVRTDIKLEGRRVRDGGWNLVMASKAFELIVADEENLAISEIRQCLL